MATRLSTDRAAVVDGTYHWREIASNPPPRSAKLQLINRALGVAVYGSWTAGSSWTHWAPLPTFAPEARPRRSGCATGCDDCGFVFPE